MNNFHCKKRIKIGVSSCLLGEKVRYDGGDKRNRYIMEKLGSVCKFVSVCPEMEAGFGVPREAVRLMGNPDSPRVAGIASGEDKTEVIRNFCQRRIAQTDIRQINGFIFKKNSPSCGLRKVEIIKPNGRRGRSGIGLFALLLKKRFPLLPVIDEGDLSNSGHRNQFLARIFAYQRLQQLLTGKFDYGKLLHFHQAHLTLLSAHSSSQSRVATRLLETGNNSESFEFATEYAVIFMKTLENDSTIARNVIVLKRMIASLKRFLSEREIVEVSNSVEKYRQGKAPLSCPQEQIRKYADRYQVSCLQNQIYLYPDPRELKLRDQI